MFSIARRISGPVLVLVVALAVVAAGCGDDRFEAGEIEIDGITYRIDIHADAEADEQIVITLPDHGVLAAGDLLYNGYHAVMSRTFDSRLAILDTLGSGRLFPVP